MNTKFYDLENEEQFNDIYINEEKSKSLFEKLSKIKHNYTSELELKSLLIRIKNERQDKGILKYNNKINKYIKWHTKINNKKYEFPSKRNKIKSKLKERIIFLSEETCIDKVSYERFGEIVLLMIKNILKKPQFSGYTYKDDFYSDAVYKILKYLCNFNHTLISERTGTAVNAFAYISQIIHNSILFIINTKKKEFENLKKQVPQEYLNHNLQIKTPDYWNYTFYDEESEKYENQIIETIHLKNIEVSIINEIKNLYEEIDKVTRLNIFYPKDYKISFNEYNELKDLLKGKVSIMRSKE